MVNFLLKFIYSLIEESICDVSSFYERLLFNDAKLSKVFYNAKYILENIWIILPNNYEIGWCVVVKVTANQRHIMDMWIL